MRIKIYKNKNLVYIQIPNEFREFEYVDLFRLKEGFYLLSIPLERNEKINENEKIILKKLKSIPYEKRNPNEIKKIFNNKERKVLNKLIMKNYISLFYNKKHPEGRYNIEEKAFQYIREETKKEKNEEESKNKIINFNDLFRKGFLVLENEKDAEKLSYFLRKNKKERSVVGIKGFDNKYYVLLKNLFSKNAIKIREILNKDKKTIEEISKILKLNENAVKGILFLMAENGEILESEKGKYEIIQN